MGPISLWFDNFLTSAIRSASRSQALPFNPCLGTGSHSHLTQIQSNVCYHSACDVVWWRTNLLRMKKNPAFQRAASYSLNSPVSVLVTRVRVRVSPHVLLLASARVVLVHLPRTALVIVRDLLCRRRVALLRARRVDLLLLLLHVRRSRRVRCRFDFGLIHCWWRGLIRRHRGVGVRFLLGTLVLRGELNGPEVNRLPRS
jgi:hypothetical protein